MVSIRRRRLLGLCSGKSSFSAPIPKTFDGGQTPENAMQNPSTQNPSTQNPSMQNPRPFSMNLVPSIDLDQVKENGISKVHPGSSNMSTSSSSKEQQQQQQQQFSVPEVKRRKRHRRKHFENQEPCIMRGVYFKNMKWQAAIKVEKKQIHLGTVGSQEEAARLYDRAAFMCGREPNFELSEEDKKELRKLTWEEFLVLTRAAISSKKQQRRTEFSSRRKLEPADKSYWEAGQGVISGSEG